MERPAYIPILKWQVCEMKALLGLDPEVQQKILPCIEIRKKKFHANFILAYAETWNREALFDYSDPNGQLTPDRELQLSYTLQQSRKRFLPLIPALNPMDSVFNPQNPFIDKALSGEKLFLRPRIKIDELNQMLDQYLGPIITRCKSAGIQIGILADFGCTPSLTDIHQQQLQKFFSDVSRLPINSVHLASGAYPGTLKKIGQGVGVINRDDWVLWNGLKEKLNIPLGYSDYASICPTWSEDVKKQMGPLAIRYAIHDKWLIVRGGNEKTTQEAINLSKLFFAVYKKLAENREFSLGDRNLYAKADDAAPMKDKHCSAADHVWEAIDHHITYVIKRQYINGI